ncbi:MAG: hypothetical protein FWE31_05350 [Firmicutes bacterium]|nr:hypothetical protein [Bacillota bacterium]
MKLTQHLAVGTAAVLATAMVSASPDDNIRRVEPGPAHINSSVMLPEEEKFGKAKRMDKQGVKSNYFHNKGDNLRSVRDRG